MSIIEGVLQRAGLILGPTARVFIFDPAVTSFSLQNAIDETVADTGDVIIQKRGYYQPSATVNFNKQGIILLAQDWGMNPRAQGEFFTIDPSNTNGPAARITKGCRIMGVGFAGAQATGDTNTACVQIDGNILFSVRIIDLLGLQA